MLYRIVKKNTPKKISLELARLKAFSVSKKIENTRSIEEVFTPLNSVAHSEPIFVKGIRFISLCEHHLVPFFGFVNIAIIPEKKIAGLSKYADLVEYYSNSLQIQERFTTQIGNKIHEVLDSQGVYIKVVGNHICAEVGEVKNNISELITTHSTGLYSMDGLLREEALKHFS